MLLLLACTVNQPARVCPVDVTEVEDLDEVHDGFTLADIIAVFSEPLRWRYTPEPEVAFAAVDEETSLTVTVRVSETGWIWSEPTEYAYACRWDGPFWSGTVDMEIVDDAGVFSLQATTVSINVTDPSLDGAFFGGVEEVDATMGPNITAYLDEALETPFDGELGLFLGSSLTVPGNFSSSGVDLETKQSDPEGWAIGVLIGTVTLE
jgi:hypothetical protein